MPDRRDHRKTATPNKPVSLGRKAASQSRAEEIRTKLLAWGQTPEPLRPSLRALARELGTSHALLQHYLSGLEKWRQQECQREAKREIEGIRARAVAENRLLMPWEEDRISVLDRAAVRAMAGAILIGQVEKIKQRSKCGPLHPGDITILRLLARNRIPGAKELLDTRPKVAKPKSEEPAWMSLSKLTSRFERLGGVLLFEDGEVRYFVSTDDARRLLPKLWKQRAQVKSLLERWTQRAIELGRYDEIKKKICQQIPAGQLKPLDAFQTADLDGGNSAKPMEHEHGVA
jgi:hypothetical protein